MSSYELLNILIFINLTMNSDGKTLGIASPSSSSQEACIREAYARAGITDFSATGFFECHGTGTAAGDPAEAMAIGKVFGRTRTKEDPLWVGSIKVCDLESVYIQTEKRKNHFY